MAALMSSPDNKKSNSMSRKTSLQKQTSSQTMSKSQANLTGIRSSIKKNIKLKEKKTKPTKADDLAKMQRNKTPENPLELSSPISVSSPSPLRFTSNNLHRRSSAQEISDPSSQIVKAFNEGDDDKQ